MSRDSDFPAEKTNKEPSLYETKTIQYFGKTKRIILQDENGLCSLIAICNVLALRDEIELPLLPSDAFKVSKEYLVQALTNRVIDVCQRNGKKMDILDFDKLRGLAEGLNVNVGFNSIKVFVDTPELAIFGLLDIPLCHGWIINPKTESEIYTAIGSMSYNELQNARVALREKGLTPTEDERIQKFMNSYQFTETGLSSLKQGLEEKELCVFYRDGHFSTMLKNNNELYQLISDEGLAEETDSRKLFWEKIIDVRGKTEMTGDFQDFISDNGKSDAITDDNAV